MYGFRNEEQERDSRYIAAYDVRKCAFKIAVRRTRTPYKKR
jgi:hypothetical protein